jgi:hypothetical protein
MSSNRTAKAAANKAAAPEQQTMLVSFWQQHPDCSVEAKNKTLHSLL